MRTLSCDYMNGMSLIEQGDSKSRFFLYVRTSKKIFMISYSYFRHVIINELRNAELENRPLK
jgi:hypothetical protein